MVIDACTVFNERLQTLTRLHELSEIVDYHVFVESRWTQSLLPKEYYLEQWLEQDDFKPFKDKIIRVAVEEKFEGNIWSHDIGQRNCIKRGLDILAPSSDSKIIIADIDEIPRVEKIKNKLDQIPKDSFITFQLGYFCYYLNLRILDQQKNDFRWNGPVMTTFDMYNKFTPHEIIKFRDYLINGRECENLVEDGGWHISYLGPEITYNKYKSCVEPMDKINGIPTEEIFKEVWENSACSGGNFIFCNDLNNKTLPIRAADLSELPKYIQDNKEKYKDIIWHE